jgi:anaphase-promoting complex subunit 3
MSTSQPDGPYINQSRGPPQANGTNHQMFVTPGNDPFQAPHKLGTGLNLGGSNFMSRLNGMQPSSHSSGHVDFETPTTNGANGAGPSHDGDVMMEDVAGTNNGATQSSEPPQAPTRKRGAVKATAYDISGEPPRMTAAVTRSRSRQGSEQAESETSRSSVPPNHNHKRTISGHVAQSSSSTAEDLAAPGQRKSSRLQLQKLNQGRPTTTRQAAGQIQEADSKEKRDRKVRATGTRNRVGTSTVGRVVSGNRKAMDSHERHLKEPRNPSAASGTFMPAPVVKTHGPVRPQPSREQEAVEWLLDLFGKLGNGYYLLSRFQCEAALEQFMSVPAPQRDTPWVQAQIGKALYQSGEYTQAKDVFDGVKRLAPSRMEDSEVYSTVLWHLKAETDLAYLSHELVEADRLSPQAWCAVGNSFSLQRDHDQAIKCFRRATQLDPRFAYAHTLQGHEHLENEEFDKALLAYRNAVATDRRHYYGWYGLGQVYEKMEKYDVAEKHYQCAAAINPTSAALAAHVGVVLEKQRKPRAALAQYTKACELDPRSALSRFKKARVLMILHRPQDALAELELLKDIAPDEANVHFMLGRLYKSQSDRTAAIRHFTIALNLDPKVSLP